MDKSILFLKLGNGRGYFHSLFFVFLSFFILLLITKGNKPISLSFLIGMIFHLILDLPEIPLFYPFVTYDFMYTENPIQHWLHTLVTNPVVQITEILGVLTILFVIIYNKLYSFKKIIDYLKTNPLIISYIETEPNLSIVRG